MNLVSVVSVLPEEGIKFSDGSHLFSHHQEDCCENHYADFNYVSLNDFEGLLFDVSSLDFIIPIEGYGFRMKAVCEQEVSIPCYGENNGYYSTNLTLVLSKDGKQQHLDISDCQEIYY